MYSNVLTWSATWAWYRKVIRISFYFWICGDNINEVQKVVTWQDDGRLNNWDVLLTIDNGVKWFTHTNTPTRIRTHARAHTQIIYVEQKCDRRRLVGLFVLFLYLFIHLSIKEFRMIIPFHEYNRWGRKYVVHTAKVVWTRKFAGPTSRHNKRAFKN